MCNVGFPKFPLDIFFSYIKLNHSLDGKSFYAICHVDGCSRVFQCFASFKRHWYNCGFINTSEPQEINVISFQADSSVENSGKPIFIALQFHAISKITLVIQVYFDEVEPSNPLGTKTGFHKIGVFYWTLLNLPTNARANLRSINLLGIINSKLLKRCGVTSFFETFIRDLQKLRVGVTLNVRGDSRVWFGLVGNVFGLVGDMPA